MCAWLPLMTALRFCNGIRHCGLTLCRFRAGALGSNHDADVAAQRAASGASELGAHRGDDARVVGLAEDRAAGDEGVGARLRDFAAVVDLDAAVDLEADVAAARFDDATRLFELAQGRRDEALPAETGRHAHDQLRG